jgi:hypothetical protein
MKRRIPLSPTQSAAFSMGRVLLLLDGWNRVTDGPLEFERAMLIDFGALHPRSILTIVPELDIVIKAHGLSHVDLSDAFAGRQFGSTREHFMTIVEDLVARDLVSSPDPLDDSRQILLRLTDRASNVVRAFTSPLSLGFRALFEVLCETWKRQNTRNLAADIRRAIPDEAQFAARLRSPFASWLIEAE